VVIGLLTHHQCAGRQFAFSVQPAGALQAARLFVGDDNQPQAARQGEAGTRQCQAGHDLCSNASFIISGPAPVEAVFLQGAGERVHRPALQLPGRHRVNVGMEHEIGTLSWCPQSGDQVGLVFLAGKQPIENAGLIQFLCPQHLVPKWIREIEEVIPEAKGVELRRIGRNAGDPGDLNDVQKFLDDFDAGLLGPKAVAVMANTSAKISSGWEPALVTRRIIDVSPFTNKRTMLKALCCPVCGNPVHDDEGLRIFNVKDLPKRRLFCQGFVPGWELDKDGNRKLDADGNPVWGMRKCNTPLHTFNQARRSSIAEYIAKQCKGRFKLLIADKAHQFKGKSSDRGVAFHQLITACKWTLTLTGTFFGGKSSSIFRLLYRLSAGVRRDFGFTEERRWAKLYGVLEMTRKKKRDDDSGEDGVFTGTRRRRNEAKEQPGVSPAIINRLLDTTVFLSLKDLGITLPDYKEEVISLDMEEKHGEQYREMEGSLKDLALESYRYMSTWLQWSLARPYSAFRDEKVIVDEVKDGVKTMRKLELMDLPAVVSGSDRLPKEDWLVNYCLAERRQGRKVLVYLWQTGTRDIQDRVEHSLKRAGLNVTVLHGNIDPRKREEWIAKRTPATDVLVCNPKLVETGLDLVMYSTVIFYEIEYSLVRRMTA